MEYALDAPIIFRTQGESGAKEMACLPSLFYAFFHLTIPCSRPTIQLSENIKIVCHSACTLPGRNDREGVISNER